MRSASCAPKMRADSRMSIAFAWPIILGNSQARPYSAISPRRAKAVPNFASSEAKRRSQNIAITSPSPTAGPLTAAITGLGMAGK